MRDGLTENLKSIFAGEEAVVLTDDQDLAHWLETRGVQAMTFETVLASGDKALPWVVMVPLDYKRLPPLPVLREKLSASSVLWIPLASFSSDLDTAKYALDLFAEADVVRAVAMNRRIATRLLLAREKVTLSGPDTALELRLPDVLQLSSRTRVALLPEEHSVTGNYFEVAMTPTDVSGRVDPDLSLSGSFRVDGVLAAKHSEQTGASAVYFDEATEIAKEIRRACPLQLEIRESRIVGGLGQWAHDIDVMSGPQYRGALAEIAFSSAALPLDHVDWNLNCAFNEFAAGIHLGIGDSLTGIHFDFISTEAWLDGT